MFQTLKNAWKITELRKKILYTLFMLLIYRVLCFIPTPGVDTSVIASALERFSLLGFINQMTGADLANYSIMAMVESGLGVAVLSELVTGRIPFDIRLKELDPPQYRDVAIAVKKGRRPSPATEKFIQIVLEYFNLQ